MRETHFPASKNKICHHLYHDKNVRFKSMIMIKMSRLKVWKIERRTGQGLRAYGHTMAEATILHIFSDILHNISTIFFNKISTIFFNNISMIFFNNISTIFSPYPQYFHNVCMMFSHFHLVYKWL